MTRLVLAVCALVLVPASPALALIQIDRGIAGARIGNTRAQVQTALGKPVKTRAGSNDFGHYVQYSFTGGLVVTFQGEDRVSSVVTSGPGDRTSNGVGVGSQEADVRALVPHVRCETIAGSRSCHTGRFAAGRHVTDFRIADGKVASVFVGVVLD
jgi:hypothetical protein